MMKTLAYTLDLVDSPPLIEKYKQYHMKVWPEVLYSVKKSGVLSSKIFLLGTRLFLYMEVTDDYKAEQLQNLSSGERENEWEMLMRNFQRPVPEAKPHEWWSEMELVYDLDSQLANISNQSEKE
ncbi:MAG: L-rhamnose mutarotase [Bacillota bacterium]